MALHRETKMGIFMTEQVENIAADDWTTTDEQVEPIQLDETEEVEAQAEAEPEQVEAEEVEQVEAVEEELLIDDEVSPTSAEQDGIDIPDDAPNWAKQLRQQYKELARENKQLKAAQVQPEQQVKPFEEAKPTLDDCDYDEAEFEKRLVSFYEKKRKHEESQQSQQAEAAKIQQTYNERLATYNERKAAVAAKYADFSQAEKAVIDSVPVVAQNAILMYSDNPELIVLAAGRKPEIRAKLAELANDPLALGVEIGRLSKAVKTAPKPKAQVEATPQVKAGSSKPISADEAAFKKLFPDAKFT